MSFVFTSVQKIVLSVCILMLTFFGITEANAQFEDVSRDDTRLALSFAGTKDGQSLSGAFSMPYTLGKYKVWANAFVNQISANNEVLTQAMNARVEAGRQFNTGLALELFVDAGRDAVAGEAFSGQTGVFIRIPSYSPTNWLTVGGGIGNFFENTSVHEEFAIADNLSTREELGLDGTVNRYLGLFSVDLFDRVGTIVKVTPSSSFKDFQFEANPSVLVIVKDNMTLGIEGNIRYESHPITRNVNYGFSNVLTVMF